MKNFNWEFSSQMEQFITANFELRRNVIRDRIEIRKKGEGAYEELTELIFNSMIPLAAHQGYDFKPKDLRMIINSVFAREYDPLKEFVNSLPKWDDTQPDYIAQLADSMVTNPQDAAFWQLCLRKWLVATIGCAVSPEVVNETVLLLTGPQGIGKTRWLTNLLPKELKMYYYSGSVNPTNKDSIINCAECFLINMDELGGFIQKKEDDFKELISKKHIRVRRPYSSEYEYLPRRCSFMGSTNQFQFLHDSTGSRRILGFEAFELHIPEFPIAHVWSQAAYLYESGFQYWFDKHEEQSLQDHNLRYKTMSIEEEVVQSLFEVCKPEEQPDISMQASQILAIAIKKDPSARRCNVRNIGIALNNSGFKPRKSNGRQLYDLKFKD